MLKQVAVVGCHFVAPNPLLTSLWCLKNQSWCNECSSICSELAFAPAKQNEEEGGIEDLKDEFARRIASVEKKLHQSLKVWAVVCMQIRFLLEKNV
jgi:hypothetical protein